MNRRTAARSVCLSIVLLCARVAMAENAPGELRLPHVFADNMVVQRDQPVRVWGRAHPGEQVVVEFKGRSVTNRADWHGRWSGAIGPFEASAEPAGLVVHSGPERCTLTNVLVGEVWLASGQSNMRFTLSTATRANEEIAAANFPDIRLFTVESESAPEPLDDLTEKRFTAWTPCQPSSVRGFSAVAYFYARELHQTLKVPVGIIMSAWGGTAAESWTPLDALQGEPVVKSYLAGLLDQGLGFATNRARYLEERAVYDEQRKAANDERRPFTQPAPNGPLAVGDHPWPGGLWNAMINPLCGYTLRGVIWYQGEANVWRAPAYRTVFPLLIKTWRERWGQGDFPFFWVQLANYRDPQPEPTSTLWAELRESQTATLALPNTGQALAIDLANADKPSDIHPANKLDVGRRLALLARKQVYGETGLVASGPSLRSFEIRGSVVEVVFDANDPAGLMTKDGGSVVTGFAVAGEDKKWARATGTLGSDGIVRVECPSVSRPVAVRYGFEDNPPVNLYNRSGLPAVPFRSDAPST